MQRDPFQRRSRAAARGAACFCAAPAPLFAAQPVYAHHPPRCSRHSLYTRTTRPAVRGTACIRAPPAPLFAAQPVYAQRPPHYSRRSRLKFFVLPFFQKR
ncbi:hypothetical protein DXC40_15790 [Anaerotruncus colihominis]|uniref:Uncharacterized protein n=1 Tax=Anaerotruncus colihominis TaxID=169435 RepID=A0A3E3IF55_9FIRM|nr:hypothetical protein DXC40_15790 [Anaerotruncus colihominis]